MRNERDIAREPRRPNEVNERRDTADATGPYRDDAHAVVIGINKYQDPQIPDLRYARADAEAFYAVLTDPEVGRFNPKNVALLCDEQATEREIRIALGTALPKRAAPDDTVVVYFAGHGAPVIVPRAKSADRMEKYMLPHDAQADHLRASAISMDAIQGFFDWIESNQIIFFIHSCYSGQAGGRSFAQPGLQARAALSAEFLDALGNEGRFVVTACGVDEVSLETPTVGHGVFTYYLVQGLKGAADRDRNGLVTLDELYEYVYDEVEREARALGGRMRPMRRGSVSGRVYLTQYETDAQRRAREASAQGAAALARGALEEAQQFFRDAVQHDAHHADAVRALRDVTERLAVEAATLTRKQEALAAQYARGALPAPAYEAAMGLLDRRLNDLTEQERRMLQLVEDLIIGHVTPKRYLLGVAYLTQANNLEQPSGAVQRSDSGERPAGGGPSPAPRPKDEHLHAAAAEGPIQDPGAPPNRPTDARLILVCELYRGPDCLIGADIESEVLSAIRRTFRMPAPQTVIAFFNSDSMGRTRYGLAIGTSGVYWRNNPFTPGASERFVRWTDFVTLQIHPRGEHLLEIGSRDLINLTGSNVTAGRLAEMLEDLCVAYRGHVPNKLVEHNRQGSFGGSRSSPLPEAESSTPILPGDGTTQRRAHEVPPTDALLAVFHKCARSETTKVLTGRAANASAPATWYTQAPLTALVSTILSGVATIMIGVSDRGVFISISEAPESSFPTSEELSLTWEEFSKTPIKYQADGVFVGDVPLVRSGWGWASVPSGAVEALRDVVQLLRSLQAETEP